MRGLVKSAEMAELKNYTMKALEFCFEIEIFFYLMHFIVSKEQQYDVLIMFSNPKDFYQGKLLQWTTVLFVVSLPHSKIS